MELRRLNSYERLRSVMLAFPIGDIFNRISDPSQAMFTETPDVMKVCWELQRYADLLIRLGVTVEKFLYYKHPNQIFLADLAAVIDDRILVGSPKHPIRKGEEIALREKLCNIGIYNSGSFHCSRPAHPRPKQSSLEAADILLTDRYVIAAVGGRSTVDGVSSLVKRRLIGGRQLYMVDALPEGIPQHLLGHKHILGPSLLLSRVELCDDRLAFEHVICVRETEEVVKGFAMNIVVIGKGLIVMPEGCPETQSLYEHHGITCLTTPMSEIHKMGGGLACCTLELYRG